MTRTLPALHEGHAPIHLHLAFGDALDAYEDWRLKTNEPTIDFEGREVPISAVFGRMRTCFDILPDRLRVAFHHAVGPQLAKTDGHELTFADAALVLRALSVERLKREAA